jgi:hypothetical protein
MNTMISAALANWRRGLNGGISVFAGAPVTFDGATGAGASLGVDERDHRLRHRGDVVAEAVAVAVIRCP